MTRILTGTFCTLTVVLLLMACSGGDSGNSLIDISKERQCRANMNTLCTDQVNYRDATGHWTDSMEDLDEYARRTRSLTCPGSGEEYKLELTEEGYCIQCPSGHGSIQTGVRSWAGE